MPPPGPTRRRSAPFWLVPALAALLVGSGFSALVYQVLWLRLLALTFGVTVYAASTVLASFMGGLALGSVIAGRAADRSRRPLRLFGLVEIGIGACALATPTALALVESVYVAVVTQLPDSIVLMTGVRAAFATAVLIVPTALMGATLPIVVKSSLARVEGVGTKISVLYAANTAGAIVGALAAGFALVPGLGLTQSFVLAAAVNVSVGSVALVLSRLVQVPAADAAAGPDAPAAPAAAFAVEDPALARRAWVLLVVSGVSGFASLALEVIWLRILGIFVGSVSYTFTVVLATVLAGIALGSALAAPLMRWRRLDWLQALALLQMAGAWLALTSFARLARPPDPPGWLVGLAAAFDVSFALPAAALSLAVVLPTSVFLGLAFPIGLRLWTMAGPVEEAGRRVGVFYSVNVGGAIFGALAGGFVLLPAVGSRASLIAMAGLFLLAGLVLQWVRAPRRPVMTGLAAAAVVAVALEAAAAPDPLALAHRRLLSNGPILWQDEGVQTTVAVVGGATDRLLFTDGNHQANTTPGMAFVHRRIGLLPAVLHPNPRRALAVGLGGGATPGGLSRYPGLTVDLVELSPEVVEAAAYFRDMSFDVLARPNVRLRVDDGRNVLLTVTERYDVITADAIIPRHAGANNLNSVEYFELVRAALNPDGVVLHWNGGATEAEHKLILSAFMQVFPHGTLWGDGSLMVGTLEPLEVSEQRVTGMLADPALAEVLALINVQSFDHLVRMFRADPDAIRTYLGGWPPLSDDRPLLEYFHSLPAGELSLGDVARDPSRVIRP